MTKRISIRMDFEGEDAKRFELVKASRGVEANTELIRLLVADAHNAIRGKSVEVPAR